MKIEASMILEMMGRPKEHLENTMNQFIATLESEKDVKVLNKKTHKIKEIKDAKREMFSTFSELEIKCSLETFFYVIAKYMPSNIEIIKPTDISVANSELSALMNQYASRLHRYDEIAKRAMVQNKILENQIAKFQSQLKNQGQQKEEKSSDKKKKSKSKKKK